MADGIAVFSALLIIGFIIEVLFVVLNLVWLFPVMTNSGKNEPSIETRFALVQPDPDNNINLRFLGFSTHKCDEYLDDFLNEGYMKHLNLK